MCVELSSSFCATLLACSFGSHGERKNVNCLFRRSSSCHEFPHELERESSSRRLRRRGRWLSVVSRTCSKFPQEHRTGDGENAFGDFIFLLLFFHFNDRVVHDETFPSKREMVRWKFAMEMSRLIFTLRGHSVVSGGLFDVAEPSLAVPGAAGLAHVPLGAAKRQSATAFRHVRQVSDNIRFIKVCIVVRPAGNVGRNRIVSFERSILGTGREKGNFFLFVPLTVLLFVCWSSCSPTRSLACTPPAPAELFF